MCGTCLGGVNCKHSVTLESLDIVLNISSQHVATQPAGMEAIGKIKGAAVPKEIKII